MSLETQIANLVTSANALTGEVSHKMGSLDARIDGFINNWGVAGYTTLEVGPDKPFPTIQAAWDSLIGKTLKADVKIKVADGVHTANSINLVHQPYAQRIRIEGNVANPDACVIRWVPDASKYSHGIVVDGVRGVNISGFRMEGSATATHWTYRHIMALNGAQVFCDNGTNKFVGGGRGLEANSNSVLTCRNCTFDGVISAVIADQGGTIFAENSNILGAGRNATFTPPNGGSERAYGVRAYHNGTVFCQGSTVNNVYLGYYATSFGQLNASNGVAENCDYGFFTEWHGFINAHSSAVKHCSTGYCAWAFSGIAAYNTSANAVNTPTLYSPANSGVLGNANGMIVHS